MENGSHKFATDKGKGETEDDRTRRKPEGQTQGRMEAQSQAEAQATAILDEEMEKVFARSDSERFDLTQLSTPDSSATADRKFEESDYVSHRKESFPHTHHPLKALHPRAVRRTSTAPKITTSDDDGTAGTIPRSFASSAAIEVAPQQLSAGSDGDITPKPESISAKDSISQTLRSPTKVKSDVLSLVKDEEVKEQPSLPTPPVTDTGQARPGEHWLGREEEEAVAEVSESSPLLCDRDRQSSDIHVTLFPAESDLHTSPLSEETAEDQQEKLEVEVSPQEPEKKRVQFLVGDVDEAEQETETADEAELETDILEAQDTLEELDKEKKLKKKHRHDHGHHHHHHHHHRRKYSGEEDLISRMRTGIETSEGTLHRVPTELDEAQMLQDFDLDDMTSHRFEDVKGLRRHKIQAKSSVASFIHIGRKDGEQKDPQLDAILMKRLKKFDHKPHEIFVELDELHGDSQDKEWKETARWIKYEEDVEEGAYRWGKPHVASLSFHSLLNLRKCLESGVILLDLEEGDLPGIAYRVVEQMVVAEQISEEEMNAVMSVLLLRHKHVSEHEGFRFNLRRNASSYTNLMVDHEDTSIRNDGETPHSHSLLQRFQLFSPRSPNMEERHKPKITPSQASIVDGQLNSLYTRNRTESSADTHRIASRKRSFADGHTAIDMKDGDITPSPSSEDLKKMHQKESIMRRIPEGAEATTVLVGSVDFLKQPTIAFVRLAQGVYMNMTEVPIPVRFLFIMLVPLTCDYNYHEIGRSISTLMSNRYFHEVAYKADDRKDLLSAINEFLNDSIVLPPGDWESKALLPIKELQDKSREIRQRKKKRPTVTEEDLMEEKKEVDDPLQRTGRPFGGLIRDIKRRFPWYMSDFTDGLNFQCIAALIFIYFAALSGAITFGGLMSDKTDNLIGISETLVATSAAGVFFSLLAGQPLIIIATTGPLLLFDESLFSFCESSGIEFLPMRVWIGIWLCIISLVVVCFEGSAFVRFFTRFTEDIFASLISLLFIYESVFKLYQVFLQHPLLDKYCDEDLILISEGIRLNSSMDQNSTSIPTTVKSDTGSIPRRNKPNTALMCTILMFGTFFIAYFLRHFRNSKFFGRNARRALGDFGVPIAIVFMVTLDYLVKDTTYTQKLSVPEGLSPSAEDQRGWFIYPGGLQHPIDTWVAFAAALPATLIYILLFMETEICELIISKKDRNLKKGTGFHLDPLLISVINMGCGLLGGPWMCAATVRGVAHVSALSVMSKTHAPGEKPKLLEVKEQRLTALTVSVLVGVSVLMAPVLRKVPLAVLFGVFLYMGVSSMSGIQFFERLQLIFMPVKHHPQNAYVRQVRTWKMHLFTMIQLLCLIMLWVVKSTDAALAFPFFLVLMIPLRFQLKRIFTQHELTALDSEEVDADSYEDEMDLYTEAPLPG